MTKQNQTITKIAIFQKKEIRKIFHKNEWWFSIIDIIEVLTDSNIPKRYWSDLKIKLKKEGFIEAYENIVRLKMTSSDGKMRETDCANTETIFRIIQTIPSLKAEPFKRWLTRENRSQDCTYIYDLEQVLINKINSSLWWHVVPSDPNAYKKRGKFLASTFNQASFYGRPNNNPERVSVKKPLWGVSELDILRTLFPNNYEELEQSVKNVNEKKWYQNRIHLDMKMYRNAKKMGYDSIVLLVPNAIKDLKINRKPKSIELNLCF